jgi:hypothetical protein
VKTTEGLLSIDLEAERRKLSEGSLEGPWQVPAELVRRALAAGARRVEVEIARGRLLVRDDGPPLSSAHRRDVALVLEERASPAERHAALLRLETEPELLALGALHASRCLIEAAATGTTILAEGLHLDAAAARRWLRAAAHFAPATVVLDGEPIERGFGEAWAEAALEAPLVGRLALTPETTAQVRLLGAGMVTAHVALTESPGFEAAVDLGRPRASAAALREAMAPRLNALVDQAVRLMLEVVGRPACPPEVRAALRGRLVTAARDGRRRAEVFRAPLVPALTAADAPPVWLSLAELGAHREGACLDPGEDPARYRLPAGLVVVLDADERGRLAQLLGIRFRPLERRQVVGGGGVARFRRAGATLGVRLRDALARLGALRAGRPLAESALGAGERDFLRALRAALGPPAPRVVLADGTGPVSHRAGTWLLPRRGADVRAAMAAVAKDPAAAYVAALALCEDAEPAAPVRERWRARFA